MVETASNPPFGMSPALPAFHRAVRLAEALLPGTQASVVLIDGERVWRSGGDLLGITAPARGVRAVIDRGKAIWAGDRDPDPTLGLPAGLPHNRFWAGAPIRLTDGVTIGVLTARGAEARAYDKALAARLQDLADSVADECERARANEAAAQRGRELRTAREVMTAFVSSVPIESVMTDREFRFLTGTPRWLETLGIEDAQAIAGKPLTEVSPDAFAYFKEHFERALGGEVVMLDRPGAGLLLETRADTTALLLSGEPLDAGSAVLHQ